MGSKLSPQRCKLTCNRALSRTVATKLQLNWAPEQIAGWLKIEYPNDESNHVSHETIYRSLFVQARGVLKKELQQYLRSQRAIRRSMHASLKRGGLGQITNAVSIRERPASVEDRAVPGHWEGDLIAGSNNSYIATLVERHTRYVMLAKVKNKDTENFPKGTDLSVHSQTKLNAVARQLNERPRKTLEFRTPAERFNACVALTG